jgi:hypothetical protein
MQQQQDSKGMAGLIIPRTGRLQQEKNRPGLPVKPTCSPRDLNYRYGFGWEPDRSMYRGRTHRFREPGPGVCYARAVPERPSLALRLSTYHTRRRNEQRFCRSQDIKIHTPLNVSISRVQNCAHNISIPMDKDKNKGVGGWVESWWIV